MGFDTVYATIPANWNRPAANHLWLLHKPLPGLSSGLSFLSPTNRHHVLLSAPQGPHLVPARSRPLACRRPPPPRPRQRSIGICFEAPREERATYHSPYRPPGLPTADVADSLSNICPHATHRFRRQHALEVYLSTHFEVRSLEAAYPAKQFCRSPNPGEDSSCPPGPASQWHHIPSFQRGFDNLLGSRLDL